MKNSFVLYTDYIDQVRLLDDQQAGILFRAILNYAAGGELPEMDGMTVMAFSFIRSRMDRDSAEYQKTVEARRKAGQLGGRPKKPTIPESEEKTDGFSEKQSKAKKTNGFSEKQSKAKKPDNVLVNDNDTEKKDTNVSKEKTSRFFPPTLEEVSRYCQEAGYRVDAERFVDFYESKGWYVGKNRMKDWKAAVRNWARSQRQELTAEGTEKQAGKPRTRFHNFDERSYDYDAAIWEEIRSKAGKGEEDEEPEKSETG